MKLIFHLLILARLENFCNHLDQWLIEPDFPALLHGDIWTNNVLAANDEITGFLDPALYFGHPEIEIAHIILWHTFDISFFERYNALNPLSPDFFEIRYHIYKLYHLLVDTRLFGDDKYILQIKLLLERFGF